MECLSFKEFGGKGEKMERAASGDEQKLKNYLMKGRVEDLLSSVELGV